MDQKLSFQLTPSGVGNPTGLCLICFDVVYFNFKFGRDRLSLVEKFFNKVDDMFFVVATHIFS